MKILYEHEFAEKAEACTQLTHQLRENYCRIQSVLSVLTIQMDSLHKHSNDLQHQLIERSRLYKELGGLNDE